MAALIVLLAVALACLGVGAAGRHVPGGVAAGLAGAGLLAGLAGVGSPAAVPLGLLFALDGLSAVLLAVLFLLGAAGTVRPVLLGALALALLAADGAGLLVALAGAVLAAGTVPAGRPWMWAAGLVLCLLVAIPGLGGLNPAFSGMHAVPPGLAGAVIALAVVGAAAVVSLAVPGVGGVAGVYLIARFLLDLSGTVTPGWWGGPVLLLGAAVAVPAAQRAAAADDLVVATAQAGRAVQGVGMLALGAALLARGADLVPLASTAVAAGLVLVLFWGVWGGLLALCGAAVQGIGGTGLSRLGGLLRRVPATGLALLVGLLSMAAVPVSPGFAGVWLVGQVLGTAARTGGLGVLLLVAGAVSVLGLVVALLAAAALRLAGTVLLGAPRSAKAAAAVEPSRGVRLGLAALVLASVACGVLPGLGVGLVQPAVRRLTGAPMQVPGWLALGSVDAPGYAAPAVLLLVLPVLLLAAWSVRQPCVAAPAWQGGFAEEGIGRGNAGPLSLRLPRLAVPDWGAAVLLGLGLVLAVVLGWAAR